MFIVLDPQLKVNLKQKIKYLPWCLWPFGSNSASKTDFSNLNGLLALYWLLKPCLTEPQRFITHFSLLHGTVHYYNTELLNITHCCTTPDFNTDKHTTVTEPDCTQMYFPWLPLTAGHNDPETIKRIHLQWVQGKQGLYTGQCSAAQCSAVHLHQDCQRRLD